MRSKKILTLVLASMLLVGAVVATWGINLGGLIKGAGMVILVNQYGDKINDAINKLTLNKGVDVKDRTKVVPILSMGQGNYIGMAQVSGPASQIDKVKAVAQIETNFADQFRLKALVPVESKEIVSNLKRVSGVGVSAIVDVKL
jgi:hypothetical protein